MTPTSVSFPEAIALFSRDLFGRNMASSTITAYTTDVRQFLDYLEETTITADSLEKITKADISEYLSHLADKSLSGMSRRRKLASLREFFRFHESHGQIPTSPAAGLQLPKREVKARLYLRVDEFQRMLAAAGGHPRDYAILQVFLQCGLRVGELVNLTLSDVDLPGKKLTIRQGKGKKDRIVPLEKRGFVALKTYLAHRPETYSQAFFLSYQGSGISDRGVKKLVEKYRKLAGIDKPISCHSLRHTFAAYKAQLGVSPFQLKEWLGHESITTTQIYVHMKQDGSRVMEQTSLPT